MRTVTGPTERVVVIGAGLSGLAAALYLTGAGRQVTVLERADHVGGRVGRYRFDDYEIDSGATVLTLPELIDDALAAVGHDRASLASPLRIRKLAPSYHARFADGSDIRVFADPDEMAAEVARTCGPGEAQRYRGLREWLARIYRAEFGEFMDTNFDSPLDMVRLPGKRAALIELVRLGGFGRLGPRVRGFLRDPRLTRLFTFQALYAGLPPDRALAVYGAIPHMDTSLGVYFPEGGMRAVAEAMAQALVAAGGRLELGAEVTGIDYGGGGGRRGRRAARPAPPGPALLYTFFFFFFFYIYLFIFVCSCDFLCPGPQCIEIGFS
ncbi:phytoene desaturase family protein, partial [Nocardia cyriacigeorgica]|uniref:phytoene desaturase family protein n=1 Tax=Nocardia cyriacigeorgica TaxID=135487 RepID=UPI002456FB05